MFELVGLEGSAKKNVVFLLSQHWPLGVKEIQSNLERQGINVSYQAVHKSVNELVEQKILQKVGFEFQLSADWIGANAQFFEKLGKSYESKTITDLEKPIYLSFDNARDFIGFLANEYYVKYSNVARKSCACIWQHAYPVIGLTEKEIENMRSFMAYAKHYALMRHTQPLDKTFSDLFEKFGKHCFVGVKLPVKTDTFLQGDFVCQVFFKDEYLKEWDKIYKKHKALDDKALEELFAFISKSTEINVLIVKNATFADKIRKDCERIIQKLEEKKKEH